MTLVQLNYVRRVLQNTVKLKFLFFSRRKKSVKINLLKLTTTPKEELIPKTARSDAFSLLVKNSLLTVSPSYHQIPKIDISSKIEPLDDLLSKISLSKRVQIRGKNLENITEYEQTRSKLVALWASRLEHLNTVELVTLFKFIECDRKLPVNFNGTMLDECLGKLLDNFSIEELGSICESLFLCQHPIQSVDLMDRLANKLVENINTVSSRTIGAILKILRKSNVTLGKNSWSALDLQSILSDYVHLWEPIVLTQIVSLGSPLYYFHHPTIEKVVIQFLKRMDNARLKDLERLSMALAVSTHRTTKTSQFWTLVASELMKEKRYEEIRRFPRSFISLVSYSVMANHYSDELINFALQKTTIQAASNGPPYDSTKRELLIIDSSLDIERPGYSGTRLSSNDTQAFRQLYEVPIPKDRHPNMTKHQEFLLDLLDTARELLGDFESVSLTYLAPHFLIPDILCKAECLGSTRPLALIAGSRNMYSKYNSSPMGTFQMKVRQLKAKGMMVVPVPWFEFTPLDRQSRLMYLDKQISLVNSNR